MSYKIQCEWHECSETTEQLSCCRVTIILFDDKVGCIYLISTSSSYRDCWCFPQAMEIRWSIHYITKYMIVSLVETYSFCTQCSSTCCLIVNLCLFLKFYFQDNLAFYDVLAMVNFQLRLHALIKWELTSVVSLVKLKRIWCWFSWVTAWKSCGSLGEPSVSQKLIIMVGKSEVEFRNRGW